MTSVREILLSFSRRRVVLPGFFTYDSNPNGRVVERRVYMFVVSLILNRICIDIAFHVQIGCKRDNDARLDLVQSL